MNDFIKLPIVLFAYLVAAPLLGFVLAGKRTWQRALVCLMVFMTSHRIRQQVVENALQHHPVMRHEAGIRHQQPGLAAASSDE